MFKNIFDKSACIILLCILFIPIIIISIIIKIDSVGPIFYFSLRIGKNNNKFQMPKFRTMKINTPELATHKLDNYSDHITKFGKFLRSSSLDEIPQLISVLIGDMSLVGPRPALYNQHDLIEKRVKKNIHLLKPGITGFAQINGRDNLSIDKKVEFDYYYFRNQSVFFDFKILFRTLIIVLSRKNIRNE